MLITPVVLSGGSGTRLWPLSRASIPKQFVALTGELLSDRPIYKCLHCGFPARLLHWQCPSCKHWNTIKPIQGVEALEQRRASLEHGTWMRSSSSRCDESG